jgi:ribonuclease BN (tRNA processing enzyme)
MTMFKPSRSAMLGGLVAAPALAALGSTLPPAVAQTSGPSWAIEDAERRAREQLKGAAGTKLVLLGTGGGPVPGRTRRMTSNVMVSNGATYVLDCGLGVTNEYARTGLEFGAIRSIFITHMHPDHSVEYGPLLVIGWVHGLRPDVAAYGPPPLAQMTDDFLRSQRAVIDFWSSDFHLTPLRSIAVHELPSAGPVMTDDNVRVTSVLVQHPPVHPAYGYRFDFADRSIAFSGDTVPLEAVARLAKGADVLVHEAMYMPAVDTEIRLQIAHGQHTSYDAFMAHMLADHSKAEDVGRIATEAGVKTLVLSHLTPSEGASDEQWRAAAATTFAGEILVGHDLMVV